MFHKAAAAVPPASSFAEPQAPRLWGFRRMAAPRDGGLVPPVTAAEEPAFTPDAPSYGLENFGRSGLELGGLHRDQQWVGAWGGRC